MHGPLPQVISFAHEFEPRHSTAHAYADPQSMPPLQLPAPVLSTSQARPVGQRTRLSQPPAAHAIRHTSSLVHAPPAAAHALSSQGGPS
jgi:hypothetical protein